MDVWLAFRDNGFYILYEFFRGRPENLLESF